jgi:hypothetical protein
MLDPSPPREVCRPARRLAGFSLVGSGRRTETMIHAASAARHLDATVTSKADDDGRPSLCSTADAVGS